MISRCSATSPRRRTADDDEPRGARSPTPLLVNAASELRGGRVYPSQKRAAVGRARQEHLRRASKASLFVGTPSPRRWAARRGTCSSVAREAAHARLQKMGLDVRHRGSAAHARGRRRARARSSLKAAAACRSAASASSPRLTRTIRRRRSSRSGKLGGAERGGRGGGGTRRRDRRALNRSVGRGAKCLPHGTKKRSRRTAALMTQSGAKGSASTSRRSRRAWGSRSSRAAECPA